MKVIDPGHVYALDFLDGEPEVVCDDSDLTELHENRLIFVKREGAGYPGNVGHHPGTNLQEVLRAMIDRVKYLDAQIPHPNNAGILVNLRHSLWLLEQRAAERHGRPFTIVANNIEELPTCRGCGHIGCDGQCGHSVSRQSSPLCSAEHASGMVCIRPAGHPENMKHKSSTGWLW